MSGNSTSSEQRYLNAKKVADEMIRLASMKFKKPKEVPPLSKNRKSGQGAMSMSRNSEQAPTIMSRNSEQVSPSMSRNSEQTPTSMSKNSEQAQTNKGGYNSENGSSANHGQHQKDLVNAQSKASSNQYAVGQNLPVGVNLQQPQQTPPQSIPGVYYRQGQPQMTAPGVYIKQEKQKPVSVYSEQLQQNPQTPSQYPPQQMLQHKQGSQTPPQTQAQYVKQLQQIPTPNTTLTQQSKNIQMRQKPETLTQYSQQHVHNSQQSTPKSVVDSQQQKSANDQILQEQSQAAATNLNPNQNQSSVLFGLGNDIFDDSDESIPSDYSDDEIEEYMKMVAEQQAIDAASQQKKEIVSGAQRKNSPVVTKSDSGNQQRKEMVSGAQNMNSPVVTGSDLINQQRKEKVAGAQRMKSHVVTGSDLVNHKGHKIVAGAEGINSTNSGNQENNDINSSHVTSAESTVDINQRQSVLTKKEPVNTAVTHEKQFESKSPNEKESVEPVTSTAESKDKIEKYTEPTANSDEQTNFVLKSNSTFEISEKDSLVSSINLDTVFVSTSLSLNDSLGEGQGEGQHSIVEISESNTSSDVISGENQIVDSTENNAARPEKQIETVDISKDNEIVDINDTLSDEIDDISNALADERPPSDEDDEEYIDDSESDGEIPEEIIDSSSSDMDEEDEVSSESDGEMDTEKESVSDVEEQVESATSNGQQVGADVKSADDKEKIDDEKVADKKDHADDESNDAQAKGSKKAKKVSKKGKEMKEVKDSDKKVKGKGKKTRKRKKKGDTDGEKAPKKRKKSFERRNIRKIREEIELDEETVKAQKEEMERRQRLLEKMERLKQAQLQAQEEKAERLKLSQLQSLLEDDDEDDEDDLDDNVLSLGSYKPTIIPTPVIEKSKSKDADVVEISSDEDEISVVPNEPMEPEEELDPNNSGSHVNDAMNQPDASGRVLVNVGHPPAEPDIFLAPQLSVAVKPHQIGGIRFLYDNLVESLEQYKSSNGLGCILAHSMGLGKTLQVICFTDVFMRYTEGKRVLVIVPVNTLQNWISEFNMWLPSRDKVEQSSVLWPRKFKLHIVNDSHKNTASRSKVVEEWYRNGGCLLMGYEMYRLLTSKKVGSRTKKPKNNEPVMIDLVEEEKNSELLFGLRTALVNPGPDLVICDEGHRIKNSHAGISQSLKNIKTRRRVVLTGYPLQNNLLEYWCMVDFVRPNFLGTRTEFANMFERPINNGQCVDSTPQDHRLMRFRAHVLHSLLEGFVQRRSHAVLTRTLPLKVEHIILVRMSPIQRILYRGFMEDLQNLDMSGWANSNPLKAFSVCCKIWNHPDILNQIVQQRRLEDNDLDIEDSKMEGDIAGKTGNKKGRGKGDLKKVSSTASISDTGFSPFSERSTAVSYDWAHHLLKDYHSGVVENSGKLVILLSILEQSIAIGDKILVFSQSLFTLSLIEEYLSKIKVPNSDEYWAKNKNYFRLDGSTAGQDREKMINQFNHPDNNKIHLFLLSTRAGCLGINLIGANRVLVFDASWNPCHDAQAVCRVYRYGQMKKCHVYRLVSDLTMEKKIYDRQINKQGMSDRVVDELNPVNSLTRKQVDVLLQYDDRDAPDIDSDIAEKFAYVDSVLFNTVKMHHKWLTKDPFTHESLLTDRKDQKLTQMEKRLARQGYEMEKKMSISYSRPSYAAFYPKANGPGPAPQGYPGGPPMIPNPMELPRLPSYRNRPVASVRPMMLQPPIMSTPIPMQPLSAIRQLHERKMTAVVAEGTDMTPGGGVGGGGGSSGGNQASKVSTGPALLKPGVSVQQVKLQSDIPVPGSSTAEGGPQRIPAGETVLVIKTPKGVYIRTPQGKIFAVRSAPKGKDEENSETENVINNSIAEGKSRAESRDLYSGQGEYMGTNPEMQQGKPQMSSGTSLFSINPSSLEQSNPNLSESSANAGSLFNKDSSSDEEISIVSLKEGRKDGYLSGGNVPYPAALPPHSGDGAGLFPFYSPEFNGPAAYQPWAQQMGNQYMGGFPQPPYPPPTAGGMPQGWDPSYPTTSSIPPVAQPLIPSGMKQSASETDFVASASSISQQNHSWSDYSSSPTHHGEMYSKDSFSNIASIPHRYSSPLLGGDSIPQRYSSPLLGGDSSLPQRYSSPLLGGDSSLPQRYSSPLLGGDSSIPQTLPQRYSSPMLGGDSSLDSLVKDLGIDQSEDSNASSIISDQK